MITGCCLCGAIQFEISSPIESVGNCHCSRCRKTHGTPFSTYAQTANEGLQITAGADRVRRYRSSTEVERTFCDTCGSNFTFRHEAMPAAVWVAAGLLEDTPTLRPGHHIFVASKASWHEITDALPQFDEYPPQP